MNGHQAAIQFDDRIAPGQVAIGSLAFGMLDSPGSDLPAIVGLQNLPLGPAGPILFLLQQTLGRRDLVVVAALRILWLLHAAGLAAATGEQREEEGNHQTSSHPLKSALAPPG